MFQKFWRNLVGLPKVTDESTNMRAQFAKEERAGMALAKAGKVDLDEFAAKHGVSRSGLTCGYHRVYGRPYPYMEEQDHAEVEVFVASIESLLGDDDDLALTLGLENTYA